jgi:hypothetical protein
MGRVLPLHACVQAQVRRLHSCRQATRFGGHVPMPRWQLHTGPYMRFGSARCLQVALIVYLAHVGCFVPADAATVGLTDRIITRIVSQERLVMQQSTFMIDLTQVATMLRRATSRSLLIIDEFGKVRGLLAGPQACSLSALLCMPIVLTVSLGRLM